MWHIWHTRPDGRVEMTYYEIARGIALIDIDLDCRTLPVATPSNPSSLTLNWCSQGRCEVDLGRSGSAVLEAGLICASTTTAHAFAYPMGPYRGFEYHIDFEQVDCATDELLRRFDVDLPEFGRKLCGNASVFMVKPAGALMHAVETIAALMAQGEPATGTLLAATCQLLALLNAVDPSAERVTSAYLQRSQRDLARRLRSAIEADPTSSGHVAGLARETGVGKASLRAYFSRMYGTAPATYAREIVLGRAAEMLAAETTPVSDVALSCGYSNPSKFSAAFRRQFGVNPTEYRRRKKLEQLEEPVTKQEAVGKRKHVKER